MPKINDVAENAGVSITTVSRVLNNRGYISESTRNKVFLAMKELNYQPNEMARSLYRKKSNMIGLIIPTVTNPFFSELTYHLEYFANLKGYKLVLCNSMKNIQKEHDYIDMLKKNQVDGILVGSSVLDVEHYLNLNLPIVSFERTLANIPTVTSDYITGGKLAAQLLLDKGCLKPALIFQAGGGPHHQSLLTAGIGQGFEDVLKGTAIRPVYMELDPDININQCHGNELLRIFNEHPEIDGVLTEDLLAAEIIRICNRLDKKIPEDIKLIGYDDVMIPSLLSPRLSSVRQPIKEMSEYIIESIIKQIKGEVVPMLHTIPVTLIERETT
ncbi:LacI family DNA-binding transcriptional regulator [Paenibacillus glycanilyticus]|uniref:LacI family transcriptional regulator n=1 Tax=Paenibacillus glycanilyticus TaxID=126569 RepID=A0ABQ6GE48_9BACL|nr:LacI family DNA-binding transcriptional regulator [Paenibacillus glycanilyticus]GLX68892.1 LacI family transcriptional regulator [Paenibacillus glycanilyticus]